MDSINSLIYSIACGVVAALECSSLHPAQSIGETNRGRLDVGADADIAFLSYHEEDPHTIRGLEVLATVIAGDVVWRARDSPLEDINF